MELNLTHPPTPEHAPTHAADIVKLAKLIHGVDLDYSPASLENIDQILQQFSDGGSTVADLGETLFAIGCYVGEVLVRHLQGIWRNTSDTALASVGGFPIVVELPNQRLANPIHRVFSRLEKGDVDSIARYYTMIAEA